MSEIQGMEFSARRLDNGKVVKGGYKYMKSLFAHTIVIDDNDKVTGSVYIAIDASTLRMRFLK